MMSLKPNLRYVTFPIKCYDDLDIIMSVVILGVTLGESLLDVNKVDSPKPVGVFVTLVNACKCSEGSGEMVLADL